MLEAGLQHFEASADDYKKKFCTVYHCTSTLLLIYGVLCAYFPAAYFDTGERTSAKVLSVYFQHTVHFSNCAMGSRVNYLALVWYVLQIQVMREWVR